jgi:hypothetical protein
MGNIKFRVWDKTSKAWLNDKISIAPSGAKLYEGKPIHTMLGELADNLLYMQFTGAKDKYNIEIYENDIVKCSDGIFKVGYYNKAYALVNANGHNEFMCNVCDMLGKVYEVIGNTLEDGELLKIEKEE